MATAVYDEVLVKFENRHIEMHRAKEEDVIEWKFSPALVKLVMNELSTMFEASLEDILSTSIHNVWRGFQSAVLNVVEHFMLDQLRKDVIGEVLDPHIARFCTLV